MYDIQVRADDFFEIADELERVAEFRPDLSGVQETVLEIAQQEHHRARAAGLDTREDDLPELAASTRNDRRRGPGPRLMPDGSSSFAGAMIVVVEPTARGLWIATAYDGVPWLKYHLPGPDHSSRLPDTHVEGLQLVAVVRIDDVVLPEIDRQLRQTMTGG